MDIGQLQAFVAVAQEGSFTRAAARLNLSQPSLSARVKQLETGLGATLVRRDSRPVQLTRLGRIYLDYATRALGVLEAGQVAVRQARRGLTGRVVVGCPFSLATYLMPDVINEFNRTHPHVELHVESGASEMVVARLLDGFNNLAFSAAFPRLVGRGQTLLRLRDDMTVAVSAGHALTRRSGLQLADLWSFRLLVVHWGQAFTSYLESLREMAAGTGQVVHLPLAAALPMARQPDTVTFLPRRLTAAASMKALDVAGFHFPWETVLLTRPGHAIQPAEQAFVDTVRSVWERARPESS